MKDNLTDKEQARVKLTVEQLDALMPCGEYVHTLKQMGEAPVLLGLDAPRELLLAMADKWGAELSGEIATAMGHGAVIKTDLFGPVFVATRQEGGAK